MSEPLKAFIELCKEWLRFNDDTAKIIYTVVIGIATLVLVAILCTTYYNVLLITPHQDIATFTHCKITTISSTEVEIKFR